MPTFTTTADTAINKINTESTKQQNIINDASNNTITNFTKLCTQLKTTIDNKSKVIITKITDKLHNPKITALLNPLKYLV